MAGNEILVDNPDEIKKPAMQDNTDGLTSWLMDNHEHWKDARNELPEVQRWAEYYRLWRGFWDNKDKTRQSERSRLIGPALAASIEQSVAEAEEALLSREAWFDVADDYSDEEKIDMAEMTAKLREDLGRVHAKSKLSEAFTNGALLGTALIKENISIVQVDKVERNPQTGELEAVDDKEVLVELEAVKPINFVPDPAGTCISDMMGFFIEYPNKPLHSVLEKIEQGLYRKDALPFLNAVTAPTKATDDDFDPQTKTNGDSRQLSVFEYHGKVPLFLLEKASEADQDAIDELLAMDYMADGNDGPLVEAIVTIANGSILLRAMPNPVLQGARAVKAARWETVPGKFWGRGVAEKGYNPQKAADSEMRGRIDTLGFVSAPMLGMDAGRVPRGFKPEVKPGKIWLTNGPPSDVLQPVGLGQVNPNTFNHTGELMQMIQMGTGALDTSTILRGNSASGGNAATGGSMMLGSFVKRSKRAVMNLERELIVPLIQSVARKYLQFAPSRYPYDDIRFQVKGALGIIAREIEQVNLTQLIGMLPEGANSAKLAAAQGFIELSSVVNKTEIMQALESDKEALQAQQEQQMEQQQKIAELEEQIKTLEMQAITLDNQKTIAETRELLSRAEVNERKADDQDVRTAIEFGKLNVQQEDLGNTPEQNRLQERRLDLQERQIENKEKEQRSD